MWKCKHCGGEIIGVVKSELEEVYNVNKDGDIEEAIETRDQSTDLENFECSACGKYIHFDELREDATWED